MDCIGCNCKRWTYWHALDVFGGRLTHWMPFDALGSVVQVGLGWCWMHWITLDAIVGFGLHWIALDVFVFGGRVTHWTALDVLGSVRHVACGLPGQPGSRKWSGVEI